MIRRSAARLRETWRGIRDRRSHERRPSPAEQKFRLAVEAAPTAMLVVDPQGRIELVNRLTEQLFGYERDELLGRAIEELVPPRFRAPHAGHRAGFLHEARQRPMGIGRELYALRKDGTEVPVEIGLSPIGTPRGTWVIAAVTDITERKQAELLLRTALAEADRASRVKDEFLAIVSHELRAPLNAVVGWAELLRRGLLDESQQQRAFQTIYANAKRQSQLVDDLLDVSRIVSGKMEVTRSAVNLHGIVNAAVEGIRPDVAAKRIQLETDIERSLGNVLADAARLQQVLSNLLANALKFTPDGGTVSLRVRRVENVVEIAVSDTGQGISPEFLPSVFEPFRQGDTSTVRKHGGLGLGLAIVKHLVEAHGGTVEAHSAGEGRGATFTVGLPIVAIYGDGDALAPATSTSPVPASTGGSSDPLDGITVLVVDDDQDARELVKLVLQGSGAVVLSAASAQEALGLLQQHPVDVVLADIAMPGEDGYTLIRKLREMDAPAKARIPAAALTSFASDADQQRALRAGFQLHLAKPLEFRTLVEAVASLVGRVATH